MRGETGVSLIAADRISRDDGQMWSGLLKSQPLLLGKTSSTTPAGREGLAPRVSYSHNMLDSVLNWLADGIGEVRLPVYEDTDPASVVGALSFRLQAGMLLSHVEEGRAMYAGVYNDLPDNGLPPQSKTVVPDRLAPMLCSLFVGESPNWLCATAGVVKHEIPLSRLTDSSLRQIQGVYAATIIAGSGELFIREKKMLSRWKTTLTVSIEYQ
ncbi:fimbrial protein [Citrobacter freundii]|nr:fimbrial protein [Citrobacter freundii]